MKDIMRKVKSYLSSHAVRRKIRAGISIMACVTVFTTTYALLLPALTLETTAACGLEEHQHTDECYEDVLVCGQEESEGHQHSEACYDENGQLICGMEESEGHQHSEDCYERQLVCGKEAHIHTEECYAKDEDQAEDAQTEEDEHTADDAQPEEDVHENTSDVTSEEEEAVDTAAETGAGSSDGTNGESENKPAESSPAAEPAAVPTEADPASGTEAVLPVGTQEPAKLEKIDFKRFLTEDTTVYYVPENGDKWVLIDDETELVPEQKVLLHFAYKLPEGTINATNAETEYDLPLSLAIKDEEIEKINDEYCTIINGDDREADSLTAAGKFEIKEETNDDDEVIRRYIALDFNQDTYTKNGGVVMTDGTVSSAPEEVEGFFELLVTAEDLLTLEEDENREASFIMHWNDDEDMDTSVRFDEEALDAFLAAKEGAGDDASAESADNAESEDFADGTLTFEGDDYTVTASFGKTAKLPKGVSLSVSELKGEDYDEYLSQAQEAVGDGKSVKGARFFDITFVTADGEPVEPQDMVDVRIDYHESQALEDSANVEGLHFTDDGPEQIDLETQTSDGDESAVEAVSFQSDAFSVYGVVYTVDFHWEVDGKVFEFGLAGGDTVSFRELLKALHILSEETEEEEFINDIADIRFSDESLVKVVPITEGITAGALKEKFNLDCEYSAELTETEIEVMNSKVFYPIDWALISLKAFNSEEYLTVEMKDGEVFKISVTDAQIQKDFISASGETYTITVTYGKDAGIPDGADLKVREIEHGSEEYVKYLQQSAQRLNLVSNDVSFARFFDIEILDGSGEKIEPKTPVQVEIAYKDAVEIGEGQSLNIVHFGESGTEIISDANVSDNGKEITYEQSSFSVTGTIIDNNSIGGKETMILIKDKVSDTSYRYYIVNNNGTLTEVGYDETKNEVSVTDPMLWTIDNDKGHIYFHSEATGFGTNLIASDYYRRYLDPSSETGLLEEKSWPKNNQEQYVGAYEPGFVKVHKDGSFQNNGETVEINHIENRNDALEDSALTVGNNGTISQGNYYLAIERDAAGNPLRLVRQTGSAGAAEFMFATASKVPSGLHLDNAVNHIDISIAGDAKVHVPLAYGDYYGPQGAAGGVIKTVRENEKLELGKDQVPDDSKDMLRITTDDMKRATISARDKEGHELDDVFYVTGFSANTSTDVSTVQVRIEGRFLCADLRGTQYEHIDAERYDGNFWTWPPQWPDNNYVNAVRQARLNNIVEYNVTVVKPVTFNLVDPDVGQLYDAEGNPITVTVDCAFSGNFNYWDYGKTAKNSGNECPPLQGNADWRQGDIPNHDMSGMDFVLVGDAENENSPLEAIEITKVIRDEDGNNIKVAVPVTNTFDIYQNKEANRNGVADYNVEAYQGEDERLYSGYKLFHSRNITVGEQGSALIYDYSVTDGMYYIAEKKDTVPETITDKDGKEYTYVKTYIETEYVRRGDKYDDKQKYPDPMHVSADYTKEDSEYRSSPEVVGYFNDLTGARKKSGFLEFYVYNIYTSGKDLPVEKVWAEGTEAPENAEVKVELWYKARRIKDRAGKVLEPLGEWSDLQRVVNGEDGFSGIEKTDLTLKADADNEKNWKGKFENLPGTITREDGVYEVEYFAKEKAVIINVSGSDINVIGDYKVTTDIKDGEALITNAKESTRLEVEKKWMKDASTAAQAPEGAEVTVKLMFAARQIRDENGNEINPKQDWSEYQEVASVNEETGDRTFNSLFANDPLLNEELITTAVVLKADKVNSSNDWKGAFENLPKTLTDANGNVYELDYTAKEDKVIIKVPGPDKTYVDEEAKDVTDNFVITVNKTEGSDDETNPTDDKVTITNTKEKVTPKVTKLWQPDPEDDTANAVVELRRYKKKDTSTATTKTEATVQKVWDDAEAPEGTRPGSVSVSLYRDDESDPVATAALNEENNWTATQRGLAKYKLDNEDQETEEEHIYRWREGSDQSEYSASYAYIGNTTVITNTYTPSKINLTVEKIWNDANDQDGKRPENLTVNLMKEGGNTPVVTVSLSEENGWKADSGLVPARETDRTPITYHWEEADVPDYTPGDIVTSGSVTTLTNSHTPETTEAEIQVVWEEGENVNPPEEGITVTLSNGEEVILNSGNNWHAKFENLPKYYNGTEISYNWSAPGVESYEKPTVWKEGTLTTITYTPEPEKDTVLVTLFTELRDNLPEGWNVNIYNVTVNGTNITSQLGNLYMTSYSLKPVSFEVPKNSTISYHYAVSEGIRLNGVASADVTTRSFDTDSQSGSRDVKFKVGTHDVNVYNVITDRTVPLNQDIIPTPKYMNVTINLIKESGIDSPYFGCNMPLNGVYRDNETNTDFGWNAEQNGENSWKKDNVRVQTDLDDNITYLFNSFGFWNLGSNDAVVVTSNAQLTYDGATGNEFVFNTSPPEGKKLGLIAQEGNVTIDVKVVPRSSLQNIDSTVNRKSLRKALFAANTEDRDETIDLMPSSIAMYSVKLNKGKLTSLSAPMLKSSGGQAEDAPEGYEIDNDFTPRQLTLDATSGWTQSFGEQDQYDDKGNEYIYRVVEISHYPSDYQSGPITGDLISEDGATITNVGMQKGSLKITKQVLHNGSVDTSNNGTYYFAVFAAADVEPATAASEEATAVPAMPKSDAVPVKTASITVRNGVGDSIVDDLPVGQYYVFELDKSADEDDASVVISGTVFDGKIYTVTEENNPATVAPNDVPVVTVKNNYETVKASVRKEWDDSDNSANKRPATLDVTLYADGVATDHSVTLTSGNSWAPSEPIADLPKYSAEDGHEILYEWVEGEMPAGYFLTTTSTETGEEGLVTTTITNKLFKHDEKTSYSGIKYWNDGGDASKRPTSPADLKVTLYANGVKQSNVPEWKLNDPDHPDQWTYTFTNLPILDNNGNLIMYTAKEEGILTDYTKTDEKQTETSWPTAEVDVKTSTSIANDSVGAGTFTQKIKSQTSMIALIIQTGDRKATLWTNRAFRNNAEKDALTERMKRRLNNASRLTLSYAVGFGDASSYTVMDDSNYGKAVVSMSPDGKTFTLFIKKGYSKLNYACHYYSGAAYNSGTTSFTNSLLKDITVTKAWKNADGSVTAPPSGKVTFKLWAQGVDQEKDIELDGTPITEEEQPNATSGEFEAWKATWKNLLLYDSDGSAINYTVTEVTDTEGKGWEHYIVQYPKDDKGKEKTSASDGETITNIEPSMKIYVTKKWKDQNGADKTFASENKVSFELHQIYIKEGESEPIDKIYTPYGVDGVGEVTYNPEEREDDDGNVIPAGWEVLSIDNLPAKTYDAAAQKWYDSHYYVVETNPSSGVKTEYYLGDKESEKSETASGIIASDNDRITIVNTDSAVSIEVTKVWKTDNTGSGSVMEWPEDAANITLNLVRGTAESGAIINTFDETFGIKLTVSKNGNATIARMNGKTNPTDAVLHAQPPILHCTVTEVKDSVDQTKVVAYRIKVDGLEAAGTDGKQWIYCFTEEVPSGYLATYQDAKGAEKRPDMKNAYNGEQITNSRITVELPSSGGPGTAMLCLSGIMLTLLAGVGMLLRRKIGM